MSSRASGLGTGLREPALAGFVVDRDRLVSAALAHGSRAAQVVLRAPAGADKTILLAQLARRLR